LAIYFGDEKKVMENEGVENAERFRIIKKLFSDLQGNQKGSFYTFFKKSQCLFFIFTVYLFEYFKGKTKSFKFPIIKMKMKNYLRCFLLNNSEKKKSFLLSFYFVKNAGIKEK
jgi:hypothetical protein